MPPPLVHTTAQQIFGQVRYRHRLTCSDIAEGKENPMRSCCGVALLPAKGSLDSGQHIPQYPMLPTAGKGWQVLAITYIRVTGVVELRAETKQRGSASGAFDQRDATSEAPCIGLEDE